MLQFSRFRARTPRTNVHVDRNYPTHLLWTSFPLFCTFWHLHLMLSWARRDWWLWFSSVPRRDDLPSFGIQQEFETVVRHISSTAATSSTHHQQQQQKKKNDPPSIFSRSNVNSFLQPFIIVYELHRISSYYYYFFIVVVIYLILMPPLSLQYLSFKNIDRNDETVKSKFSFIDIQWRRRNLFWWSC